MARRHYNSHTRKHRRTPKVNRSGIIEAAKRRLLRKRKEKKILAKAAKKEASRIKAQQKEMKKRGAKEVKRLAGSKVDLHMMRTTTGRQLVEVKAAPTGGIGTIEDDGITIDLGGGIVESGGRVIKESEALNNLMEELEWIMLESDISSDAVTTVMNALKRNLIGRLRSLFIEKQESKL